MSTLSDFFGLKPKSNLEITNLIKNRCILFLEMKNDTFNMNDNSLDNVLNYNYNITTLYISQLFVQSKISVTHLYYICYSEKYTVNLNYLNFLSIYK